MRPGALTDTVSLIGISQGVSTDRYGNPVDVEAAPVTVPAFVSPQTASEDEDRRDTRITYYTALIGADVDADALSEVEWRGTRYEVVGEPQIFSTHRGAHHQELTIRSITG